MQRRGFLAALFGLIVAAATKAFGWCSNTANDDIWVLGKPFVLPGSGGPGRFTGSEITGHPLQKQYSIFFAKINHPVYAIEDDGRVFRIRIAVGRNGVLYWTDHKSHSFVASDQAGAAESCLLSLNPLIQQTLAVTPDG